jgi:hypothetical protein
MNMHFRFVLTGELCRFVAQSEHMKIVFLSTWDFGVHLRLFNFLSLVVIIFFDLSYVMNAKVEALRNKNFLIQNEP